MLGLQIKIYDRQTLGVDPTRVPVQISRYSAEGLYIRSYLWMRLAISALGVCLPVALIVVDWLLIDKTLPEIRGSMSAYYHSPAAIPVFVGGLAVTAAFLLMYMGGARRTYDYWLSTLAGIFILLVMLFPTARVFRDNTDFQPNSTSCEDFAGPPVCSGLEALVHEDRARLVHQVSAVLVVLLFAVLCVVFALRELIYGAATRAYVAKRDPAASLPQTPPNAPPQEPPLPKLLEYVLGPGLTLRTVTKAVHDYRVGIHQVVKTPPPGTDPKAIRRSRRRVYLYPLLALAILLAGLWGRVGRGVPLWGDLELRSGYLAEMGAFFSFGAAWLLSGDYFYLRGSPPNSDRTKGRSLSPGRGRTPRTSADPERESRRWRSEPVAIDSTQVSRTSAVVESIEITGQPGASTPAPRGKLAVGHIRGTQRPPTLSNADKCWKPFAQVSAHSRRIDADSRPAVPG